MYITASLVARKRYVHIPRCNYLFFSAPADCIKLHHSIICYFLYLQIASSHIIQLPDIFCTCRFKQVTSFKYLLFSVPADCIKSHQSIMLYSFPADCIKSHHSIICYFLSLQIAPSHIIQLSAIFCPCTLHQVTSFNYLIFSVPADCIKSHHSIT